MGGTAGSRGEAEKRRESLTLCQSLGEQGRRKEGGEARGSDSEARAHMALEQAWTWGNSSSELGTKEQGCLFWLAVTNDCSSSRHLVIDGSVREHAHRNNCCLSGWGMQSWAKKAPLEMVSGACLASLSMRAISGMFAQLLRYLPAHDTALPVCACKLCMREHVPWCDDMQISFRDLMMGPMDSRSKWDMLVGCCSCWYKLYLVSISSWAFEKLELFFQFPFVMYSLQVAQAFCYPSPLPVNPCA